MHRSDVVAKIRIQQRRGRTLHGTRNVKELVLKRITGAHIQRLGIVILSASSEYPGCELSH